MSWKS